MRDLDVTVHAGTILGMVGPSGCGKTTTVRMVIGVYRPDEGEVTVLGEPPADRPTGGLAAGSRAFRFPSARVRHATWS